MKKIVLLFTLLCFSFIYSQKSYTFSYDTAGNQTEGKRFIYIANTFEPGGEFKNGNISNEIPFVLEENLTYYPNPVRDILYLKWTNIDSENIRSFALFSMTGALLKKYEGLEQTTEHNISFSEYPSGTYIVTIGYSSGEERSIKIIKQ